jgi:site-specific DNA-adenine methylase
MTVYHGGKKRIGKELADILQPIVNNSNGYCEPFCGMLGVFQHIKTHNGLSGDMNKSVIMMWNKAKRGWTPPSTCSKEQYLKIRDGRDCAEKGYICHEFAFQGIYMKCYAGSYGKSLDHSNASKRVCEISRTLKKVRFTHGDYKQFSNLEGYVIYCDPPYKGTFCNWSSFNNSEFWDWCLEMSMKNTVYVSEYSNPPYPCELVWSKDVKLTGCGFSKVRTEKLFRIL